MRVRKPVALGRAPLVEVVVPCYNYGRFLTACVGSVVTQSDVQVKVTIVDDCSTDDSAQIAERLVEADRRVRLIRHTTNAGHIATYNDGLARVDSDYVVLLSADDLLARGALARASALLEARPSVGLAYGRSRNFRDDPPSDRPSRVTWSLWDGQDWVLAQFRRGLNAISSPETVVRTTVQHQVGYYDPKQPHAGDLDMWLRIASVSDVGHVNGPDHAFRRVHDAAMSQNHWATVLGDLGQRVVAYRAHLGRMAPGAERERLRATMSARMIDEALAWALAQARSGRPETDLASVRELVGDLDPRVEQTRAWRNLVAAVDGGGWWRRAEARTWATAVDLRDRQRWRSWERWGM
jgi:hypothetical protein